MIINSLSKIIGASHKTKTVCIKVTNFFVISIKKTSDYLLLFLNLCNFAGINI